MVLKGEIESNIRTISARSGAFIDYNIDKILMQSSDGKQFFIDFEEGNYTIVKNISKFELTSLSRVYEHQWHDLEISKILGIENDYTFFRGCKIKEIWITFYNVNNAQTSMFVQRASYKILNMEICIDNKSIRYKTNNIVVVLDI